MLYILYIYKYILLYTSCCGIQDATHLNDTEMHS